MKSIVVYYDLASPYCYGALLVLRRYLQVQGATRASAWPGVKQLKLVPVLMSEVFSECGAGAGPYYLR